MKNEQTQHQFIQLHAHESEVLVEVFLATRAGRAQRSPTAIDASLVARLFGFPVSRNRQQLR